MYTLLLIGYNRRTTWTGYIGLLSSAATLMQLYLAA